MSTTLTIRNLDAAVKQQLRLRAASHQRSMEAEAREILATHLAGVLRAPTERQAARVARRKRIEAAVGVWQAEMDGRTTDEIMQELRQDD